MEDFRYLSDSFWKNEQTGETRVNWFIGIVAAAAGCLFGLSSAEHGPRGAQLRLMVTISLFALVAFGIVTLFRLIKRNEVTDGYKQDCDAIREIFRDHLDADHILLDYHPFRPFRKKEETDNSGEVAKKRDDSRKFGGLAHIVLTINSLLFGGLAGAIFYPGDAIIALGSVKGLGLAYLATTTFSLAFVGQFSYVQWRDDEAKKRLVQNAVTHAGGIVYQIIDGVVQYRLVGPKDDVPNEWLLPRGHIEKGEEPWAAAIREVREEAGVLAQLVCLIGRNEFKKPNEERVVVKYYLMEAFFEFGKDPTDQRRAKWFGFDEALKSLTHVENKYLLHEAERRRTAGAKLHSSDPMGDVGRAVSPMLTSFW